MNWSPTNIINSHYRLPPLLCQISTNEDCIFKQMTIHLSLDFSSFSFPFSFYIQIPVLCPITPVKVETSPQHLIGKKVEASLRILTYLRKIGFSFSYGKHGDLLRLIKASNDINGVSKFDNFLSFGTKQNALHQIFLRYDF